MAIDQKQLVAKLMATFVVELDEHVGVMSRCLLALEKTSDSAARMQPLAECLRAAHSLKGAARSVGLAPIEACCHKLEEVFASIREQRIEPERHLVSTMLTAIDALTAATLPLRKGGILEEGPLRAAMPALRALAAVATGKGPTSSGAQAASTPAAQDLALGAESGRAPGSALDGDPVRDPISKSAAATGAAAAPTGTDAAAAAPTATGAAAVPTGTGASAAPTATGAAAVPTGTGAAAAVPTATGAAVVSTATGATVEVLLRVSSSKVDSLLVATGELASDLARRRAAAAELLANVEQLRRALRRIEQKGGAESALRRIEQKGGAESALQGASKLAGRIEAQALTEGRETEILERRVYGLDREAQRLRMLPFSEAATGLERLVRDLAGEQGKDVELVLEGLDAELDRAVIETLKAPLLHLVRNAVDHGIELPAVRRAAGKKERARITVSAAVRDAQVEIQVKDDGRGLDLPTLSERLRARGIDPPASERELAQTIFLPGISTAAAVTAISGRGIGLDVVKSRVEGAHGAVEVESQLGAGALFQMVLPLTLTSLRALTVLIHDHPYAIPNFCVQRLVRFKETDLRILSGRAMLSCDDRLVPVVPLADVLGLPQTAVEAGEMRCGVIVQARGERCVFLIDQWLGEQDFLIKPVGRRLKRSRLVAGASLLPTGRVVLLLSPPQLIEKGRRLTGPAALAFQERSGRRKAPPRRILIAEDSLTVRTLETTLLESAGYEVLAYPDGEAAWQALMHEPVDLIVSDVDMPRRDGIELTRAVRSSPRLAHVPIILVTARASDEDRRLGLDAGADAYVVKSTFDQTKLLEQIASLL